MRISGSQPGFMRHRTVAWNSSPRMQQITISPAGGLPLLCTAHWSLSQKQSFLLRTAQFSPFLPLPCEPIAANCACDLVALAGDLRDSPRWAGRDAINYLGESSCVVNILPLFISGA